MTPRPLSRRAFLAGAGRLDHERTHGDLLLTVQAGHPDTVLFALRQLMRRTRSTLVLRWVLDGFSRRSQPGARTTGSPRNLMGFIDGTANLHGEDATQLDRHVWVAAGDGEPSWATGGSYQAVRVIRMPVEFWDRTPLADRRRSWAATRRAGRRSVSTTRPTTPGTPTTRPASGSRSHQRSLRDGFLVVQARLNGEPLEEYILPEGGGFFFALPGAAEGGRLGAGLV